MIDRFTSAYEIRVYYDLSCDFKILVNVEVNVSDKVCLWLAVGRWFSNTNKAVFEICIASMVNEHFYLNIISLPKIISL